MMQHLLLIALVCAAFSLASGMLKPTIQTMIQRASADLTGASGAVRADLRGVEHLERPGEALSDTQRATLRRGEADILTTGGGTGY